MTACFFGALLAAKSSAPSAPLRLSVFKIRDDLSQLRPPPRPRAARRVAAAHSRPEPALSPAVRVFVGEAHPRDHRAAVADFPLAASAAAGAADAVCPAAAARVFETAAAAFRLGGGQAGGTRGAAHHRSFAEHGAQGRRSGQSAARGERGGQNPRHARRGRHGECHRRRAVAEVVFLRVFAQPRGRETLRCRAEGGLHARRFQPGECARRAPARAVHRSPGDLLSVGLPAAKLGERRFHRTAAGGADVLRRLRAAEPR